MTLPVQDGSGWHNGDEAPPVPKGHARLFQIAVRRDDGNVYTFPAAYLNAMPLVFDDERPVEAEGDAEGMTLTTGWHSEMEHYDLDTAYYPLDLNDGKDAVLGWAPLPKWEAVSERGGSEPPSRVDVQFMRSPGGAWETWTPSMNPKPPTQMDVSELPIEDGRGVLGGLHFYAIRYPTGQVWDAVTGWSWMDPPRAVPAHITDFKSLVDQFEEAVRGDEREDSDSSNACVRVLYKRLLATASVPVEGGSELAQAQKEIARLNDLPVSVKTLRAQVDELRRDLRFASKAGTVFAEQADALRKMLESAKCPDPRCSDGSIISTGPEPQNDACEWCYGRHLLLNDAPAVSGGGAST